MTIAFYAPMKPPDDPVPSGDRTMGRALVSALREAGLGEVRLWSSLRTRDGAGDPAVQAAHFAAAAEEVERLAAGETPDLWVTYHSYYKAPDLLGPTLAGRWGIPYVQIEASRARKRLAGPHARFAEAAEAACDRADAIFHLTEHDREALERDRRQGQTLAALRPFLDRADLPPAAERPVTQGLHMLACGMFRDGDKMASYTALAAALGHVRSDGWSLAIAGDGPMRSEVEALFAPFGPRITLLGALEAPALAKAYDEADLLVWPGVGEAFGMVYLEAQAHGCPVLAEDRPGVRDVVRDGGLLAKPGDPAGFAGRIDRFASEPGWRLELGRTARRRIAADHLRGSAARTLAAVLQPLLGGRP